MCILVVSIFVVEIALNVSGDEGDESGRDGAIQRTDKRFGYLQSAAAAINLLSKKLILAFVYSLFVCLSQSRKLRATCSYRQNKRDRNEILNASKATHQAMNIRQMLDFNEQANRQFYLLWFKVPEKRNILFGSVYTSLEFMRSACMCACLATVWLTNAANIFKKWKKRVVELLRRACIE